MLYLSVDADYAQLLHPIYFLRILSFQKYLGRNTSTSQTFTLFFTRKPKRLGNIAPVWFTFLKRQEWTAD